MIEFQLTNTVSYPVQKIFSFLSDFNNMPLWNYYIQGVSLVSDKRGEAGTTFVIKRAHDSHLYKVIEYDLNRRIRIELQPPGPLQYFEFILEDKSGSTFITYLWQVDLTKYKLLKFLPDGIFKNWILSFAKRHVMKQIKPATEQNFFKLKTLLETGKVTLQDGRNVTLPQQNS